MSLRRKIFLFLIFLFLIGGSFYTGNFYGKLKCKVCPTCPVCLPKELDFSLFWEVYGKLKEKFIDKEKIDLQQLIYGAITGMVNALGDPYTVFLTPEQSKRFEEDVKGTFEGVGMEIGIKKGQLQIIAPLEGTPAQKAGLKAGDIILKIDDKLTENMSLDEAVSLIRGPKGTKVRLTIFREGWEKEKEFEITRELIEIPSLKWEMKDDIIYLKIYQFSEKAAYDFARAAVEILQKPSQKMILDLRDNPGGYLEVANEIASWFLEEGKTVVIEEFSNGKRKEYKSNGIGKFLNFQIVVLINKGTASGAEILAGALRDQRGILLIGEKSFGKGSVQEVEKLTNNSALKITIARWLTPKGELISEVGLEPDIKIENPAENGEEKDLQLEKAIEVLKSF